MASMDSTFLEILQLSFGDLCLKNDGSATTPQAQGNRVSSSLHLNGSLTGVFPGSGLSNRESILDCSKIGSFEPSFNLMNLNGTGYQPYGFPNENPGLPSHPEAISTGGNLLGSGFNIGRENSSGFWTQQRINGIVSPGGNGIITLAMTEGGSKYLQGLLLDKDPRIKNLIIEGVIEYIFQLLTNQYGRYLFQKLIELEDENHLCMIMEKLTFSCGDIFYASIDKYGSYSIKKLIKVLEKSPLVTEAVKAFCKKFWELMVNPTGQYVIMECLDAVDSQKNDLLYIEAINNCLQLATHERGCISLNSFISRIRGPRRDQLLNLISDNVVYLAQDPSGNFVVQCVIGLQNPSIIDKICSKLKGYYVKLSMQKGGSHIVEKCLRSSGKDYMIHEFLQSNQLFQVAKDRYGNYVLQTALKETKKTSSSLHESLVKLQQHLNSLQHGYGRNILALMTATLQLNKA